MAASASLGETAEELYGLPPGEFTAARDAAAKEAKADGDKELAKAITGLRKPTVTAWLVNLLVREQGETVGGFLELGGQLREAQANLSGPELKELNKQRQQTVSALARQVRRIGTDAGQRVTEDTLREVEATLAAALADPDAAEAVRAGQLVTALSYSGLGEVSGLVAPVRAPAPSRPSKAPPPDELAERRAERQAAAAEERRKAELRRLEEAVSTARSDLAEAQTLLDDAEAAVLEAGSAHEDAVARVEQLSEELAAAQKEQTASQRAAAKADREQTAAERAHGQAGKALARAEAALEAAQ